MKNILKLFWLMFSYNQICMAFTDTKGRTFSLAFFPEYTLSPTSDARNILYFSSALDGGCTVSYNDGTRHQTNVHVIAGDVVKLALPDTTQLLTGTRVEHKAIYVNCSTEIALYGHNKFQSGTESSDAFTVLTEEMLSTDYLVASVEKTANLGVVATRDNTAISVTLNATCDYVFNSVQYGDGDTVSVTLGYGDVFQLGLASESGRDKCDLGGSRIHSNHMVAVFSGALYVRKPSLAVGHMVSQVPPENAFTKTVIVPKVETDAPAGMTLRVLARENNTVVTMTREEANGTIVTSSTSLSTAEFEDINSDLSADVIIQSNRPIMCIQNIYFRRSGGSSLFVPGTDLYDNNYIVQSLDLDGLSSDGPFITIVSEVSSFMDVRVNGQQRDDIKWTNLTTVPYAVGVLRIQPKQPYVVNSSSPILVRLHERLYLESYSYNAGYRLPSSPEKLTGAIELKCLAKGWFVTLDVDVLHNVTLSHIYMGQSKCTGTLHGNQLIFNQSYTECHTETSVSNGMVMFKNRVMYVAPSADNVVRHVIWVHSISCSEPVDGTNAVHIYPDFNETVTGSSTGHIQGPSFDISLFKDSSYQHLFSGNHAQAKIGEPVFVQVSSSDSPNTIMVLRSCDAQIGNGKEVPHPLIENGCAVDARTQILVTRNSVTRFEFEMFDLPEEQDGIYVTCHVTFCDQSDFSDKCKQQCHTSPPIIG